MTVLFQRTPMTAHIYKTATGRYTLEEIEHLTGTQNLRPIPPRFSPEDKYGRYRREIKRKELQEKWLY